MNRTNFYYLPKQYHDSHRYCVYIIAQIEALVIDKTFAELRTQTLPLSYEQSQALQNYDGDIISFFELHNMTNELNVVVSRRLLHALIMDTCYFLQEGYTCSLKMRMSVAFTLLRKPFSEILIIYLQLLLDEQFIERFNNVDGFNPVSLSKAKKIEYLNTINSWLGNIYVIDEVFEYLFDKNSKDNLYNISNQAIHLFTNKNPILQTEKQNLNFIFNTQKEIDNQWNYIYTVMPMLLSFLADVIELAVIGYTDLPDYIFKNRFKQRYQMRTRYKVQ